MRNNLEEDWKDEGSIFLPLEGRNQFGAFINDAMLIFLIKHMLTQWFITVANHHLRPIEIYQLSTMGQET